MTKHEDAQLITVIHTNENDKVKLDTNTSDSMNEFCQYLGRQLAEKFQDHRGSDFLFQRVSLTILRGNAIRISPFP